MQEIEEVISLIKNGQWHTLEDIINKAKLPQPKTKEILQFLADHNFIDLDNEQRRTKVTMSLARFLKEDQTC